MLEFINVKKIFKSDLLAQDFVAVNDLSFKLTENSITGFLGANGAGKTTSLKIAMDFIRKSEGEVRFNNLGNSAKEIFSNIGYLPERPFFYPHLTGREFSFYMGKLVNLSKSEIVDKVNYWAPKFKIDFALDREIRTYSKGMLQRIGFLVTLLHDPKLIILDEPLSGLDPVGRKELKEIMKYVHAKGKTVFFSSHIVSDVEEVCSEVVFIKDGTLAYQGSVDELLAKSSELKSDIIFLVEGVEKSKIIDDAQKNKFIAEVISSGGAIVSVKPIRPTLEEVIYNV